MAKNWLCKIGIHKHRDLWRGEWNGRTQSVVRRCLRCEQEENVLLVSPLSGPCKGEMHPDAERLWDERNARWSGGRPRLDLMTDHDGNLTDDRFGVF